MNIEITAQGEVTVARQDGTIIIASKKPLRMEKTGNYARTRLMTCQSLREVKAEMNQLGIGWVDLTGKNPPKVEVRDVSKAISQLSKGQCIHQTRRAR